MTETAANLLRQLQCLSDDDRQEIAFALLHDGSAEADSTAWVILDRIAGPFVPLERDFFDNIKLTGRESWAKREGK